MKVEVIIITRNRSAQLNSCLSALNRQEILPTRVIVVDSSDNQKSSLLVKKSKDKLGFELEYIQIPHVSIPYARNQGLKIVREEIIAFTDDDCRPTGDWVANVIESHKKNPQAVIIGGKVLNQNRDNYWAELSKRMLEVYRQKPDQIHETKFLSTSNFSFKRKNINRNDIFFDEKLLSLEDVDFCRQVIKVEGKILYDPNLVVYHDFRVSLFGLMAQWFFYGRGNYLFYRKYDYSIKKTALTEFMSFLPVKKIKFKLGFLLARVMWLGGVFHQSLISKLEFNRFFKKINQFSIDLSKRLKTPWVFGYPWEIMIEPNNICNAGCPLCPRGANLIEREKGYMGLREFEKIVDEVYRFTRRVFLWHYGEPFMNPNIFKMIRYAHDKGLEVVSSTNGYLFYKKANIGKLLDSKLDRLIISFDGMDEETLVKYRKNVQFNKLMKGLKKLVDLKHKKNSAYPKIELQFIVMKHNQHQLESARELAGELGVEFLPKKLNASMVPNENLSNWIPEDENLSHYHKVDGKYVPKKLHQNHTICEIWQSLVINWNGNVNACIYDYQNKYNLGNVKTSSVFEIWNSKKLRNFRKRVLNNKENMSLCSRCLISQRHTEDFL